MTKAEICQFVLSTRSKQELSQSQLAMLVNKRRQAIIEIEKGIVDFRIGTLLSVLDMLDCEIEIIPKKSISFDFSKVKPAHEQHGPFSKTKKKTK